MSKNTSNKAVIEQYNFFAFFSNWLFIAIVAGGCYFLFSSYHKSTFKNEQYVTIQNEFFDHISDYLPVGHEFYHFDIQGDSLTVGSYTDFANKEYCAQEEK